MIVYTSVDSGCRYTYLSGERLLFLIKMKELPNA